jgi:heme ABC exporter ATP-binding subunit CcmA
VVLLAGPNGAGKTTLLRLLAGLLPLASGTAIVLGHDLAADRHTVRAELALVGHAPGAYDDLTVRENVRFWVRAGGGRVSDADAVVEQLGLSRLAGVAFGRLSAGQQRRTGLAVALARRPRLLLLDEPHAGLDATGRDLLDELLKSSAREGRTVLLVSHELDRARALADREVMIVAGAIRPPIPSTGHAADLGDTPKPPGLSHGTQPDQLPAPERVSVPRPDGGGAR